MQHERTQQWHDLGLRSQGPTRQLGRFRIGVWFQQRDDSRFEPHQHQRRRTLSQWESLELQSPDFREYVYGVQDRHQ